MLPQKVEKLILIRGDSLLFEQKLISNDGAPLTINDVSSIYLTLKSKMTYDAPIILQKTLADMELTADGVLHGGFAPEETEALNYGTYYFDIEVTLVDGYRASKNFELKITEEVTTHGGN